MTRVKFQGQVVKGEKENYKHKEMNQKQSQKNRKCSCI